MRSVGIASEDAVRGEDRPRRDPVLRLDHYSNCSFTTAVNASFYLSNRAKVETCSTCGALLEHEDHAMSSKSPSASSLLQLQDFYTVKDLARRWRVSERHVRRLIDAGKLKVTRIEKAIRISAANVTLYEAMQGL